jgi:hypothetical protein
VDISSFSAGYGAVREIVKDGDNIERIRRIVLADSLYAGYEPIFTGAHTRRPARGDIEPWRDFALLAARGNKQFAVTYSRVPTGTYANSVMCARWIGFMAGQAPRLSFRPGDDFQLLERVDVGGLHLWGYSGDDADAHMVHARRIAEIWLALDGR